jgi:hypothetical protein
MSQWQAVAMGDETNGDKKSQLDGIEEILRVLVDEHAQFHEKSSTAQSSSAPLRLSTEADGEPRSRGCYAAAH